jgi:hypothetical protein
LIPNSVSKFLNESSGFLNHNELKISQSRTKIGAGFCLHSPNGTTVWVNQIFP